MRISLLVAMAENGIIGRDGKLPWHISDDLKRFKRLTMGHTVIMGRKTWEGIGRPLDGRRMVVITRQKNYLASGVLVTCDLDAALALARVAGDDEAFVIGGATIYELALPRADRIYMSLVLAEVPGDVRFPDVRWIEWRRVDSAYVPAGEGNELPHMFYVFDRACSQTAKS